MYVTTKKRCCLGWDLEGSKITEIVKESHSQGRNKEGKEAEINQFGTEPNLTTILRASSPLLAARWSHGRRPRYLEDGLLVMKLLQ